MAAISRLAGCAPNSFGVNKGESISVGAPSRNDHGGPLRPRTSLAGAPLAGDPTRPCHECTCTSRTRPAASPSPLIARQRSQFERWRGAIPGLRVLEQAIRNYIDHQSANQAGSVSFSTLLAMFPLLLFVSAAAAFIGRPGDAAKMATRVVAYAPQVVADALQPVIQQVLGQRSQALLAVGAVMTIWAASSGMQAIRTALNRTYGVERGLSFWRARIKVTLFTVVVGVSAVVAFGSVVVSPVLRGLLQSESATADPGLRLTVRYGVAFVVVAVLYALMYGWLPDVRQRLRTVLPGAIAGAAMWVAAAAVLSHTLHTAGKLALVYGGFTGVVATLLFLYVSAVTLIFGAEINAALSRRSV